MQFSMGSPPFFLHRVRSIWIDDDGKRGVGGKGSQDGDRCKLRIGGARKFNRFAKRTLRLRQIIQGDSNLGKHKRDSSGTDTESIVLVRLERSLLHVSGRDRAALKNG